MKTRAVMAAILLAACSTAEPDANFVKERWGAGVRKLDRSMKAVYPPTEDVQIGDVYAVEVLGTGTALTDKQSAELRSLRLGYIPSLRDAAAAQQRQRLRLPNTTFQQGNEDSPKVKRTEDQGGVSNAWTGSMAGTIPVMAIPEYTLASGTVAEFAGSLPAQAFGALFGFSAAQETKVHVSVNDTNTIGVLAYTAEEAIYRYCYREDSPCDPVNVAALYEAVYGEPPKHELRVMVVNRIYTARTIDYSYSFLSAAAARLVAARLDTMQVFADRAKSLLDATSGTQTGNAPDDPIAARDKVLKGLLDGMNSDLSALAASKAPGAAIGFGTYSGSGIKLSQSFIRPLTFAYGSVSYIQRAREASDIGSIRP